MATITVLEKASGNSDSMRQPVFVFNDDFTDITPADAMAAAVSAAPATFFDVPQDYNPSVDRLSNHSFRIGINYKIRQLRKLTPLGAGEERYGFSFQAEPKFVAFGPEIARFPGTLPTMGGIIDAQRHKEAGVNISPPAANLHKTIGLDPANVTQGFVRGVAGLVGCVNSVALTSGFYPIGSIMLVSVSGELVDNDTFSLRIGWSWKPNVTGLTVDEVTGIAFNGHDFAWPVTYMITDRNEFVLTHRVKGVYVNRVHTYADLSALGTSPP